MLLAALHFLAVPGTVLLGAPCRHHLLKPKAGGMHSCQ